ncbi:MAG: alpha/beta hydrolase [Alphaproteobacteria bacterium]|nr:alpha/beta hydrolase [Alphaproteobacteria bacterium]
MSINPIVKGLLDQMAQNPAPKLWELAPEDGRAMYMAMAQLLEPQDVPIGRSEDMTAPGPAGPIPVRVYTPMGAGNVVPALVYFHGGGFVIGNRDTHDALCRQLANESGFRVFSVDYRLAPEHPFPAAVEDAFAAVQWVETKAAELGIDPNSIAVAGDSAGGNLAAVVCQMAKAKGAPNIGFQLLIYPTTQARADTPSMKAFSQGYLLEKQSMDWFYNCYIPKDTDISDPRLSPLLASDLSGLPRAYIVTAGFDPLKDEGRAYADKLNRAGVAAVYVDYPDMIHGFFNMSGALPQVKTAIAAAAKAMKEALAQ